MVSLPRECIQEPLAPSPQSTGCSQCEATQDPSISGPLTRVWLRLGGEYHRDNNGFGDSTGSVPSSWACVVPWHWIPLSTDGTVGMLMISSH